MQMLLFLPGLIGLCLGAEVLVRGASGLARALGLPALVIGLTVVAYGTSAPELAVSIGASLRGSGDLALGNVVGSNTFNVLFILGLSALILPLAVSSRLVRLDVPLMIGVSLLAWALAADGGFGRAEGVALTLLGVAYTVMLIVMGRRETRSAATLEAKADTADKPDEPAPPRPWVCAVLVVAGLALLVLGSRWFVSAATALASSLGISELLIGLTIVAGGTSLPEVATSVVAALRGQRDIAVGNVVGSNLFNVLGVLGLSAAIAPGGIAVNAAVLRFDLPVMVGVAVVCLPVFLTAGRISRGEGALLLLFYAGYIAALTLSATGHAALGSFRAAMLGFLLPLSALGLAVSVWQHVRSRSRA